MRKGGRVHEKRGSWSLGASSLKNSQSRKEEKTLRAIGVPSTGGKHNFSASGFLKQREFSKLEVGDILRGEKEAYLRRTTT